MRDVGRMGEAKLRQWAAEAGITCNPAEVDTGGWDFLLQLPPEAGAPTAHSLDRMPPAATCLVQVKSSDDIAYPDVKLSNWKRFADPALPSFFLVLQFNGGPEPESAYLAHVDDQWIGKVLKRLRTLSIDERDQLHKHTMRVSFTEADRLEQANGACLKNRIQRCTGPDMLKYQTTKRLWWENLGYDEPSRYRISMSTTSKDGLSADEQLAEFALGRLASLPSTLTAMDEVRFGIPQRLRSDLPQDVTITLPVLRPLSTGRATFSSATRRASFDIRFYSSRAMFPFLKGKFDRFRISCDQFDVVCCPESRSWTSSFSRPDMTQSYSLAKLITFGQLLLMHQEVRKGGEISIQLKLGDAELGLSGGSPASAAEIDELGLALAKAAVDAGAIARHLDLDLEMLVTPNELVVWRKKIAAVSTMLGTDRDAIRIEGEVDAACPESNEFAYPVVAAAFMGKCLVILAAVVHGPAQFSPVAGVGRKRFKLSTPSLDIVEKAVVLDGSQGRHSTSPYYAKLRQWIADRGYLQIPTPLDGGQSSLNTEGKDENGSGPS